MYSTIPNTQTRPKQRSTCITWSPHPNAIMQGAGEHRTRSAQRCISHSSVRVTKHSQHQPICKPQATHRNTHAYERCVYECICTQIIRPDRFVLHASAHSLRLFERHGGLGGEGGGPSAAHPKNARGGRSRKLWMIGRNRSATVSQGGSPSIEAINCCMELVLYIEIHPEWPSQRWTSARTRPSTRSIRTWLTINLSPN